MDSLRNNGQGCQPLLVLGLSAGQGDEPAPGAAWEVRTLAALERRASGKRHLVVCCFLLCLLVFLRRNFATMCVDNGKNSQVG